MNPSSIYLTISIVAVAAVVTVLLLGRGNREQRRLTPLAGVAFAFVIAGVLFGESRVIGYGLLTIGVVLAIVDIFRKAKSA